MWMTKSQKYEQALITIWKLGSQVFADNRWCSDSSYLAGETLKKANPKLFKKLDDLLCKHIKVSRDGTISWPKKITKKMRAEE